MHAAFEEGEEEGGGRRRRRREGNKGNKKKKKKKKNRSPVVAVAVDAVEDGVADGGDELDNVLPLLRYHQIVPLPTGYLPSFVGSTTSESSSILGVGTTPSSQTALIRSPFAFIAKTVALCRWTLRQNTFAYSSFIMITHSSSILFKVQLVVIGSTVAFFFSN
jgi:hypothetical protein